MNLIDVVKNDNPTELSAFLEISDISQDELSKALFEAISTSSIEIIQIFLHFNINVNYECNLGTLLTKAVDTKRIEVAKILLAAGANTSIPIYGEISPPLMIAAAKGDIEAAKILVEAGADVNQIEPRSGDFALMSAASSGSEKVFLYLAPMTNIQLREKAKGALPFGIKSRELEENANFFITKITDYIINRDTKGIERTIEEIIDRKIDINNFDETGNTALNLAVSRKNITIAYMLLKSGANVKIKNINGETALDIAFKLDHDEMVKMLTEWSLSDENGWGGATEAE
jgi:uncharacterized protein